MPLVMLVLRPLRSRMIENGRVVSPRPGCEFHFDSVMYLVNSLCDFGNVTFYVLFPSLDNISTHLHMKCMQHTLILSGTE